MRDSYEIFFKNFEIDFQDIIKFGIEEDTIYPEKEKIIDCWEKPIFEIENNWVVYIRGYWRDAKWTHLYQELFELLLNNKNIKKDPTNNSYPRRTLEHLTGYFKNWKKANIRNYQVSHVFGKTKNPFLFTAPWNVVWKPKILGPFTWHESRWENTKLYRVAFEKKAIEIYSDFIQDYNSLAKKYFSEDKLNKAFAILEEKYPKDVLLERFKQDARNELSKIDI